MLIKTETAALPTDAPGAPFASASPLPPAAEPELVQRERQAVRELFRLVGERAAVEPSIDTDLAREKAAADEEFESDYQAVIARFAAEKEAAEAELAEARRRITGWYRAEKAGADKEYLQARKKIVDQYDQEKEAAKSEFQEARWTITAVYEGNRSGAEKQLEDANQEVLQAGRQIQAIERETAEFLQACRQSVRHSREKEPLVNVASGQPREQLREYLALAEQKLEALKALKIPRWFKGERLLLLFAFLWLLSLYPSLRAFYPNFIYGLGASTLGAVVVGLVASGLLYTAARNRIQRLHEPLVQALAGAQVLLRPCKEEAAAQHRRQQKEGKRRYNKEVRQAADRYRKLRAAFKQRRVDAMAEVNHRYRLRRGAARERRTREWDEAATRYRRLRAQIQERYERQSKEVQERYNQRLTESKNRHEERWRKAVADWREGLARLSAELAAIATEVQSFCPAWNEPGWDTWAPPSQVPPGLRFGTCPVDLGQIPGGVPQHERFQFSGSLAAALPALLPFPDGCSLLIKASDGGRTLAVESLQAIMFRLLTALPPGKVRFTIIDPVGLGRNFASFMHLADHDESLVTSRIWTELPHIEQRLADLTGHMENVIQKYLRNQFETIEDYNLHAGEVAEPYRVLVVANFPVNFSSEAARRLVSIVHSGRRCGVHTFITVDTKQPLPQGFNLEDLEQPGVQLVWENERFLWQDEDLGNFPLQLDGPPPETLCTRLLRVIGERAREAKRVEVPFEFVAPPPAQWWQGDSRPGLNVPLGRVGATKRQYLRLGEGTAQHVLIAGKTGSGKSTLLHALISNLALCYSPEEVELYLVDFKKGVEFKTYAAHGLPHARVVAVESEREFGLSVLQRLDAELRERGEKFRALGAQDLRAYRQANGNAPLPRILLIVDEFQEFFVEDDKIAQEAALLLDRLVRQGRAFGLHVLLGSQTLGGAYTLARSTIDQMAVRIALQCSEADGHLILSEDNSAARLLSRPGEAIYNDANGLVEGNNPFQVVWLADERREDYLQKIQEMFQARLPGRLLDQIVFEGNAPADPARNPLLAELLQSSTWPARPRSARAWLGEAIAIKDPTAAIFRAQSGNNLLIIGQNDAGALGILATALISLAAQYRDGARFYVLDGTPDDSEHAGLLGRLAGVLPQPCRCAAWREVPAVLQELADEMDRRQRPGEPPGDDCFLIVHGLQRFRDLRRSEDDFSFSRRAEERPDPARQFATLLREGPGLGIHALVWCDSLNNVNRALERQSLREFEMRVLFQMSAADSSNLIDTPLASKLGFHRAYFHSEDQGRLEKFRPYGAPAPEWLASVKSFLAARQPEKEASR
jgi:DNA segregation ATPase FtsK/SpoIIIE, S-DNA-T family